MAFKASSGHSRLIRYGVFAPMKRQDMIMRSYIYINCYIFIKLKIAIDIQCGGYYFFSNVGRSGLCRIANLPEKVSTGW